MFEYWLRLQGFDLNHASRSLRRIPLESRVELDRRMDAAKWNIARHHFENNPFYRAKVGSGLPGDWQGLPILNKSDYQQDLHSMISRGQRVRDLYVSNTSGSSGHPFSFAKNKSAHASTWALVKERYAWHGLSLGSLQARFYGIPLEPMKYAREKFKDILMRRVRFPVFDLSDAALAEFERRFRRVPFIYVYGYTNSLVLFARFLIDRGVCLKTICPSLKICITTSEVCTDEDREILTRGFGVRIVNEYGASEVGIIAFENAEGDWILSEENLCIEIVDDGGRPVPDGQPGALLVTDLNNRAMPFIRYNIGDVGTIRGSVDDLPDQRKRLVRLDGRVNDTIILPSGRKSPGLTFYYISRSILESSGVLKEFVIRQTALRDFVFDVVSDRDLTAAEETEIQEKMDLYLEPGLHLRINRVSSIQRSPAGKIKHFYSELAP